MKKKWFALGCLTSIVILIVFLILVGHSLKKVVARKKTEKPSPNSYLHVKLSGEINEYSEISETMFGKKMLSIHNISEKIKDAGKDPNIKGIILEPKFLQTGYANVNEIAEALKEFQSKGKRVHCYLELNSNRDYLLASLADKIYLNPSASAGIVLTGVGSNMLFYKELFNKLGIDMKVVHAGKYKGAGEMFSRNSFSPPVKRNLTNLYTNIYEKMLTEIAENRNISKKEIRKIYEDREEIIINQDKALEYNLVDELKYRKDLFNQLEIKDKSLISINKYRTMSKSSARNRIAVVYAEGQIMQNKDGYEQNITSSQYNDILEDIKVNDNIKAVVIRVNSPGGSALESEIILNKIKELKKIKPVVISMGNVAASGGYYIACDSDHIIADPFTITGSIGVVGMFPNLKQMADKIGVNSEEIKNGKYANLLNPFKKPNEAELKAFEKGIEKVYLEFKTRVSEGRDISLNKVENVAQGQVWFSNDALAKKLVDDIGNLDFATQKAADIAKLEKYSLEYFPKQKTFFEYFLENRLDIETLALLANDNIIEDLELKEKYNMIKAIADDPIQAIAPADFDF